MLTKRVLGGMGTGMLKIISRVVCVLDIRGDFGYKGFHKMIDEGG